MAQSWPERSAKPRWPIRLRYHPQGARAESTAVEAATGLGNGCWLLGGMATGLGNGYWLLGEWTPVSDMHVQEGCVQDGSAAPPAGTRLQLPLASFLAGPLRWCCLAWRWYTCDLDADEGANAPHLLLLIW